MHSSTIALLLSAVSVMAAPPAPLEIRANADQFQCGKGLNPLCCEVRAPAIPGVIPVGISAFCLPATQPNPIPGSTTYQCLNKPSARACCTDTIQCPTPVVATVCLAVTALLSGVGFGAPTLLGEGCTYFN